MDEEVNVARVLNPRVVYLYTVLLILLGVGALAGLVFAHPGRAPLRVLVWSCAADVDKRFDHAITRFKWNFNTDVELIRISFDDYFGIARSFLSSAEGTDVLWATPEMFQAILESVGEESVAVIDDWFPKLISQIPADLLARFCFNGHLYGLPVRSYGDFGTVAYLFPQCASPDGLVPRSAQLIKFLHSEANLPLEDLNLWSFCGAHTSPVKSVVFTPDGTGLVSVSYPQPGMDHPIPIGALKIWDATSGECIEHSLDGPRDSMCTATAFNRDGSLLAVGFANGTVKVWHVGTGECLNSFAVHTWPVKAIAFSPDDQLLASGTSYLPTLRVWNVTTGNLVANLPNSWPGIAVGFSPDGKILASSEGDYVNFWDVTTQCTETVKKPRHYYGVCAVAFNPDGTVLAVASRQSDEIKLLDIATRRCVETIFAKGSDVRALAFSPSGRLLAVGTGTGRVELYDLSARHCITAGLCKNEILFERVNSLAFNLDGTLLAKGTEANTIRIMSLPPLSLPEKDTYALVLVGCLEKIFLNTASEFKEWLTEDEAVAEENIKWMAIEEVTATEQVAQILAREFRAFAEERDIGPEDKFIMYFVGHSGGADVYFAQHLFDDKIPPPNQQVHYVQLFGESILGQIPALDIRLFVDCCYSGRAVDCLLGMRDPQKRYSILTTTNRSGTTPYIHLSGYLGSVFSSVVTFRDCMQSNNLSFVKGAECYQEKNSAYSPQFMILMPDPLECDE